MQRQNPRLLSQVRLIHRGQCSDVDDRIAAKTTGICGKKDISRELGKAGISRNDGDDRRSKVSSVEGI